MTLYAITDEIKTLAVMIDEMTTDDQGSPRDLTDEDRAALLALVDEIQGDFSAKAERICRFRADLLANSAAAKAESDRLSRIARSDGNKADSLKWLLETCMIRAGMEKADAGTFKLAIQRNPPSVFIAVPSEIPEDYQRIIPETREPDKKKILEAMKAGEKVPGAMLTQGSSLRIR